MSYIEIRTKRLILKPSGMKYNQDVNEYAMDLENTKYQLALPNKSEEETKEFLRMVEAEWNKENQNYFEFSMLYDDKCIGGIGITIEDGVGELGWTVNKRYWRNGFAFEAAETLIKYFSEHMDIRHFIAHCDAENVPSYKLMEKLGMKKTGEWGGRRNRSASEDSFEYQYELVL
ncbi:MAG: GNAT family N-acetyltransferase [Eubacteriales bacterium]|nr:GNAT family N-acetyltransferase [Eubacteriales bacterium]